MRLILWNVSESVPNVSESGPNVSESACTSAAALVQASKIKARIVQKNRTLKTSMLNLNVEVGVVFCLCAALVILFVFLYLCDFHLTLIRLSLKGVGRAGLEISLPVIMVLVTIQFL